MDYLILADFYSKVILVHNLPAGQSNSAKVIHIPEEWVCHHGMPEVLCTENGPQYVSAAFAGCSFEWGSNHETSSPHHPQSHGFAESCVKIIRHMLQHAKYSGTNPRIALQHLKATPVDAKLLSPSQMLYNCKTHATISSRIHNSDPAAPPSLRVLQATCTILCWYTNCHIWHPEKNLDTHYSSLCPSQEQLPSMHYKWNHLLLTRCHLWEHSVKFNNSVPEAPSTPLEQAHTRFPRPVLQPTTTSQQTPQLVEPVTSEPKPTVQVSTPAAMPKVTPVATPTSTPSIAPVQPWQSGHAHTAPKCLITEM